MEVIYPVSCEVVHYHLRNFCRIMDSEIKLLNECGGDIPTVSCELVCDHLKLAMFINKFLLLNVDRFLMATEVQMQHHLLGITSSDSLLVTGIFQFAWRRPLRVLL